MEFLLLLSLYVSVSYIQIIIKFCHLILRKICVKFNAYYHFQDLEFVELYSPVSQPLAFTFYFLTVICTISVWDRLILFGSKIIVLQIIIFEVIGQK